MNKPKYFIINPLHLKLFPKEKETITEIEKKFYNKMEKIKNISLQNKKILQICNIKKN